MAVDEKNLVDDGLAVVISVGNAEQPIADNAAMGVASDDEDDCLTHSFAPCPGRDSLHGHY